MAIQFLRRWLIKRLSRTAGPYLKAHGLLQANKYIPAAMWEPQGRRVLVLAPHMDDEVIGCGGTLYKHVRRGAEVTVVYFTDGRYAGQFIPGTSEEARLAYNAGLTAVRKQEASLALAALGAHESIFLDVEDGKLSAAANMAPQLQRILEKIEPDLVYLPFFLETHPDHRAVSRLLLAATDGREPRFDCCGYEVWTPLFPNCLVDISSVIAKKQQALQCYQSQLAETNYLHAALGLNAYRAIALGNGQGGFVEAFFRAALPEYRDLYNNWILGGSGIERACLSHSAIQSLTANGNRDS